METQGQVITPEVHLPQQAGMPTATAPESQSSSVTDSDIAAIAAAFGEPEPVEQTAPSGEATPATPPQEATPSQPAPLSAPTFDQNHLNEMAQLRAELNALRNAGGGQAAPASDDPAPIAEDRLNSPDLTMPELMQQIRWEARQEARSREGELQRQIAMQTSQGTAQAQFSPEVLGQGRDFNSLRSRYTQPQVLANPQLSQFFYAFDPQNPALGEMATAVIMHAMETHKDPAKAFRAMINGIDGNAGAMQQAVGQVADHQRQQLRSMLGPSGRPAASSGYSPGQIANMSDEQFDKLDQMF